MAQTAIEGKDVVMEAVYGDEYVPFACITNGEFYYDTELIEKATVGMAGFRGFVTGMGEWGIRQSTVTHIESPTGSFMYTVFHTLLEQLRKNGLDIRLIFEDRNGNLQVITGHVLIPHTGITSPADGFSEDDVEFKGDGAFALTTTLADPEISDSDVQKIEYTATGGEPSLLYSELIGRTILSISRDGIAVPFVLAPASGFQNTCVFDPALGLVDFVTGLETSPLNPGEWVLILYK